MKLNLIFRFKNHFSNNTINFHKFYFNLVEVTLAIAIVGLGAVSIMSLFPVGLQATRDAVGDNYSGIAVDSLVSCLKDEFDYKWNNALSFYIEDAIPDVSCTYDTSPSGWTDFYNSNGIKIHRRGTSHDVAPSTTAEKGLFHIYQGNSLGNEFSASARVWYSLSHMSFYKKTVGFTEIFLPKEKAIKINLELSWPIEKPYSKREKKFYNFDIGKN